MMKKIRDFLVSIFIIMVVILFFVYILNQKNNKTLSADEDSYSRSYLQNLVVSTALSYYYNQNYSDYEQKAIDEKGTMSWRSLRNSPEMISRSNYFMIDCSGFASIVYLYSLGYDLSENVVNYYNSTTKYRNNFYDGELYSVYQSANNYQKYYLKRGSGPSTGLMSKLASLYYSSKNNRDIEPGDKFLDSNNESEFVYYYRTKVKSRNTGSSQNDQNDGINEESSGDDDEEEVGLSCNTTNYEETCEEQEQIKSEIINMLQPGDLLVYRRREAKKNNDNSWDESTYKGHVVVYVGDILQNGEKGFIHSTGSDYNFDTPLTKSPVRIGLTDTDEPEKSITVGEDTYSVKYDIWENVFKSALFLDNDKEDSYIASYEFVVLRPINKYCSDDSCSVSNDLVNSFKYKDNYDEYLENTIARNDISRLKVEQYRYSGKAVSASDIDSKNVLNNNNSVNVGDSISYRLVLQNKSQASYCTAGSPSYATEAKCVTPASLVGIKELKWQKVDKPVNYENIRIEGLIPENTEFVSCSNNCNHDGNKVTWTNLSFLSSSTSAKSYTYEVKVVNNPDQIVNEGMTLVTPNNHILKFGEIKINVNTTINNTIDVDKMHNTISQIETEVSNNDKSYDSELDFISDIYDRTYGINLDDLTYENIKDSIYVNSTLSSYSNYFVRRYDNQFNEVTGNENDSLINRMLVPGLYGGRMMVGNDNDDRPAILIKKSVKGSLEVGDILVTYNFKNNKNYAWIFYGYDSSRAIIFKSYDLDGQVVTNSNDAYTLDNNIKTGWRIFKEIYAYDLFVVLRPTRVYGTIVRYQANNGIDEENKTFIAYNKYKDLMNPTAPNSEKVTLNYGDYSEDINVDNVFNGWYSDSNLTNKVNNNSNLVSDDTHVLYAGWKLDNIELPSDEKNGVDSNGQNKIYVIEGWYSDSNLTNKVGNPGDSYELSKNQELYAKWIEVFDYRIKQYNYDEENGIINDIKEKTSITDYKNNFELNTGYTIIVNSSGDYITTGSKVKIYYNGSLIKEYTNIIKGDVNCDGKISSADYVKVKKHIMDTDKITDSILLEGADANSDGKVSSADYVRIKKYIMDREDY